MNLGDLSHETEIIRIYLQAERPYFEEEFASSRAIGLLFLFEYIISPLVFSDFHVKQNKMIGVI